MNSDPEGPRLVETGSPGSPEPAGGRRPQGLRPFWVAAVGLVVVIVVAMATRAFVDGGRSEAESVHWSLQGYPQGSLVSAVTGTTDRLTPGEEIAGPTLAATPGRVQPSEAKWAAVLPRLEEIADGNPTDVNAQRKLALAYYNLGLLEKAKMIYEQLLADEEDPVLRNRLGNTLRDMGDITGAESAYRKAITDTPSLAPPYVNLAELLWRRGETLQALAVLYDGLAAVSGDGHTTLEKAGEVLEKSLR